MTDKLFGALSLCRKAGRLRQGMDVVCEAVEKGECALMLLSAGLSPRSVHRAMQAAEEKRVPARALPYTMEQLLPITGKPCGILAVCDRGFAGMIAPLLGEEPVSEIDLLPQ